MKRILILGSCGSGKSTLARLMGFKLGFPVTHMDVLFWKPGWVESSDPEMMSKLRKVIRGKTWIVDGNYGRFLDMRLKCADTVVYLDINKWICRWRVIKRWLSWYGRQRPDMAPGCPEKMDWEFFMWVWKFDRSKTLAKIASLGRKHKVIRLNQPGDLRDFLDSLEGGS